jgi:hypothetical protein
MNTKEKLADWLASREKDYREGVKIFKEFGINCINRSS